MSKLWEIGAELDAIGIHIIEAHGEIGENLEKLLDDLEMEFTEKATRIALLVRQMEADALAAKYEEDRLAKIRKGHERSARNLKKYLQHCMVAFNYPFIKSPRAKVRLQTNSQPSVRLADGKTIADIAPEYVKAVPEIDKSAVLRAHANSALDRKDKTAPDGFVVEFGQHVRIY